MEYPTEDDQIQYFSTNKYDNTLTQFPFNQASNESFESLKRNPSNPNKVISYLLQDQSNIHRQSQENYGPKQQIKYKFLHKEDKGFENQKAIHRSSSGLPMDKTFPNPTFGNSKVNINLNQSKGMDLSKSVDCEALSPKSLIQSCLTFNLNEGDEDISFLNQALQPDKIFDLPMALLKVQKAFQQTNSNAVRLKESLELVLKREATLQEKYEKLKKNYKRQIVEYEEDIIQGKSQLKDQLREFSSNVLKLQSQLSEKDSALNKLKEQLNEFYSGNQELRGQLELKYYRIAELENSNATMKNQLMKKDQDLEELRNLFQKLQKQEEASARDIDHINDKWQKEIKILRNLIEEKNVIIEVLQKDMESATQLKKLASDSEEKLLSELNRLKVNMRDDIERKYIELLEYKKRKDQEGEELLGQLNSKKNKILELQRKLDVAMEGQVKGEEELGRLKKEMLTINEKNHSVLSKQRESYETRLKELESEISSHSVNRYKLELEEKSKHLKVSKKYESQLRELKSALGYLFSAVGVEEDKVPEHLREDLAVSVNEVHAGEPMMKALAEFDRKFEKILNVKDQKIEVQTIRKQYDDLLKAYKSELFFRRTLHNQLQELKGNVRVLCRIRPLLTHEYKGRKRDSQAVQFLSAHSLQISGQKNKEQTFNFDKVFPPDESQEEISEEVQQLITSSLDGYNVCIMAYGQTGSGKTYTMIGTDQHPGLYFSGVDQIFEEIAKRKKAVEYEVYASFVEIYNESLRDLLGKKGGQTGQVVKVRENGDGETVSEQKMKRVKSQNQVLSYLKEACMNRTVGVTHYNDQSSRSHFVFTLFINGKHKENKQSFRGRLNLIDLAGSERIFKSESEGERVKEALNINQSLTTLGKVFLALQNKQAHAPYRDSKLTHYLKDSLGGDSKTMVIIQVSPSLTDHGESVSSLNFGSRISCIEKGQPKQTISSPNKSMMQFKRNKSTNGRLHVEFEIPHGSITPKYFANGSPSKKIM